MNGIIDLGTILEVTARFWPAFVIESAVIAFVYKASLRELSSLGHRLTVATTDTSGLWSLPLYLWAYHANLSVGRLFSDRGGLASSDILRILNEMEAIFVALFYLLVIQAIGTILTKDAPATLGLTGHPRTAVTAAILSVFLNMALFFRIL